MRGQEIAALYWNIWNEVNNISTTIAKDKIECCTVCTKKVPVFTNARQINYCKIYIVK